VSKRWSNSSRLDKAARRRGAAVMVGLLAYIWAASQSQSGPITPRFI
jgi:hypothetical protein